jgi:hypothetical protein
MGQFLKHITDEHTIDERLGRKMDLLELLRPMTNPANLWKYYYFGGYGFTFKTVQPLVAELSGPTDQPLENATTIHSITSFLQADKATADSSQNI